MKDKSALTELVEPQNHIPSMSYVCASSDTLTKGPSLAYSAPPLLLSPSLCLAVTLLSGQPSTLSAQPFFCGLIFHAEAEMAWLPVALDFTAGCTQRPRCPG